MSCIREIGLLYSRIWKDSLYLEEWYKEISGKQDRRDYLLETFYYST